MKKLLGRVVVWVLLVGCFSSAVAGDVGMPLYKSAAGKHGSIEVYYEQFNRDLTVGFHGETIDWEQEEERVVGRISYNPSSTASIYLELGSTEADGAEDAVQMYGVGLRVKMYDSPKLNVNAHISAQQVNDIEYKMDGGVYYGWFRIIDFPDAVITDSYTEFNGGVSVSRPIVIDKKSTCTPYAGLLVSMVDGEEDIDLTYHVRARTVNISEDIEDDGAFTVVTGLGLTLGENWGLRFEGRFVNQTSFSAGLMCLL